MKWARGSWEWESSLVHQNQPIDCTFLPCVFSFISSSFVMKKTQAWNKIKDYSISFFLNQPPRPPPLFVSSGTNNTILQKIYVCIMIRMCANIYFTGPMNQTFYFESTEDTDQHATLMIDDLMVDWTWWGTDGQRQTTVGNDIKSPKMNKYIFGFSRVNLIIFGSDFRKKRTKLIRLQFRWEFFRKPIFRLVSLPLALEEEEKSTIQMKYAKSLD